MRDGDTTPPPEDSTPVQSYRLPLFTLEWYAADAARIADRFAELLDVAKPVSPPCPTTARIFRHIDKPGPRAERRCGVPVVQHHVVNGAHRVVPVDCDEWNCSICGPVKLDAIRQTLRNALNGVRRVYVGWLDPEAKWSSERKRIGDAGGGGHSTKTDDGAAFVVSAMPFPGGRRLHKRDAIELYLAEVKRLHEGDDDGARSDACGSWRACRVSSRDLRRATSGNATTDADPWETIGIAGRSIAEVDRIVRRMGGFVDERGVIHDIAPHLIPVLWRAIDYIPIAEAVERRLIARSRADFEALRRRAATFRAEAA